MDTFSLSICIHFDIFFNFIFTDSSYNDSSKYTFECSNKKKTLIFNNFVNFFLKDEGNIVSFLEEDIKFIIEKHKNGSNAVPYLTLLVPKCNQQDRWKVLAQICSYSILFTNNLRFGVELFLMFIEESDISISDLIIVSFIIN